MDFKTKKTINELMSEERIKKFSYKIDVTESDFILYDLSKTHLTEVNLKEYRHRLIKRDLKSTIENMWNGEAINFTEKKPVLHYLLRKKDILDNVTAHCKACNKLIQYDTIRSFLTQNVKNEHNNKIKEKIFTEYDNLFLKNLEEINKNNKLQVVESDIFYELIRIYNFCKLFDEMKGVTNKKLKYIVSIGIGGSDLGPKMVCEALEEYSRGYEVYFISNVDSSDALKVLKNINIEETLFIIVSKTFTTLETIENFKLVKSIGLEELKSKFNIAKKEERISDEIYNYEDFEALENKFIDTHFIAVSSNISEIKKYGINIAFEMWDFVGGRYSLWSAVGISIALYVGFDNFIRLLSGAAKADQDFYENQENSLAVLCAIIDLYYADNGYNNKCIVAYDSYLTLLYKYMQQAEMESNGKKGSKQMIIWGGVGTDVQHSFFQLLHQGEQKILTEFLLGITSLNEKKCSKVSKHQEMLISNCLAQSRSLMIGNKNTDEHKNIIGDKPSTTILYSKLVPECLGALIGIYEHKIFTQGIYYDINSYDQYGVSLGKEIALDILNGLENDKINFDPSTNFLIKNIKK